MQSFSIMLTSFLLSTIKWF